MFVIDKLYLEGIIFKSMPFPAADGKARYDGATPIFDGDIEIALELRRNGAVLGEPVWVKLSHCGVEPANPDTVPAFTGHDDIHSAQGFGKYAKGGRYGHVYTVTSTGDDKNDPTTLRYAVQYSPVPRTVIFALPEKTGEDATDGNITLTEKLIVKDPRLTIAGQTAFQNGADGICIKGNGITVETDDVVIRYIRVRPGPAGGGNVDAITIDKTSSNIIIDHCSTSFSTDTLIDVTGKKERPDRLATVQNSILSWPLDFNNHDEGGGVENHGYGSLIRAGFGARITYWRNLYAHCRGRCPRPGTWESAADDPNGMQLDFVNNVIYGWSDKGNNQIASHKEAGYDDSLEGAARYNFIANYYRGRLDANWGDKKFFRVKNPEAKGWFEGNRIKLPPNNGPSTPVDQFGNDYITYGGAPGATSGTFKVIAKFGSGAYEVPQMSMAGGLGEKSVKANVGASIKRDQLDIRLLAANGLGGEYESRGGSIIDSPAEVGAAGWPEGWPPLATKTPPSDADADGIPNADEPVDSTGGSHLWKDDPRNSQLDDDGDGHTNLEEHLSKIVNP